MPRPTHFFISHAALQHNFSLLQTLSAPAQCVAVIKANAYGCGIENAVTALEGLAPFFAVATIEEALAIRKLGSKTPIIILQGVFDKDEWLIASLNHFYCVIHQKRQLDWLLSASLPKKVNVWIKINTGMNRLGFMPDELDNCLQKLINAPFVEQNFVVMSHFANADIPGHPLNQEQQKKFLAIMARFQTCQFSLNNSAALFQFQNLGFDYVRPGLSLYGVSPFHGQIGTDLGLRPVMHFRSRVTHLFTVETGESIGYGSTWTASQTTTVAVIPVGYGDGYPRHVRPLTPVWIQGSLAPIIGRISMDSMTVDVTHLADINIGNEVELWGGNLPIEKIADAANTISYELLTQIKTRG